MGAISPAAIQALIKELAEIWELPEFEKKMQIPGQMPGQMPEMNNQEMRSFEQPMEPVQGQPLPPLINY